MLIPFLLELSGAYNIVRALNSHTGVHIQIHLTTSKYTAEMETIAIAVTPAIFSREELADEAFPGAAPPSYESSGT